MRPCVQTFTPTDPEGWPKVGRGESFADDHPVVLANGAMFGPAEDPAKAAPVLVAGAVVVEPEPEPDKPSRKKGDS